MSVTEDDMQLDPIAMAREDGLGYSPVRDQTNSNVTLQSIGGEIIRNFRQLGPDLIENVRNTIRQEMQDLRGSSIEETFRTWENPNDRINLHFARNAELEVENNHLEAQIKNQDHEIKSLKEIMIQKSKEYEMKIKKLHQIIIESGQTDGVPDDDYIVSEFDSLNNSIMRMVKKHYTTYKGNALDKIKWKEYLDYSLENRELYIRSLIADWLFDSLLGPTVGVYGLDKTTDDELSQFAERLRKSGKVSEADITDWRVCTALVAKSLDDPKRLQYPYEVARSICKDIEVVHKTRRSSDLDDALDMMKDICERSLELALLFKRTKASFSWQQIHVPTDSSEIEVIGTLSGRKLAGPPEIVKVVFGSVVKDVNSNEADRVVLRKAEVLVGPGRN